MCNFCPAFVSDRDLAVVKRVASLEWDGYSRDDGQGGESEEGFELHLVLCCCGAFSW